MLSKYIMETKNNNQDNQKVIYTDGIYDLFHRGHLESFLEIKKIFPDCHLIVGIINDTDSTGYKRPPIYNELDRYCIIENLRCVDEIVSGSPLIITEDFIEKYSIDMIVHGFSNPLDANKQDTFFEIPKKLNKFMEIPYYSKISTTEIIQKIKNT